jgi:threonylcarbamoyladenosine tRNA methylthiotransferase MtaB
VAEYHVENFGCRASQADGASIAARLDALGLNQANRLRDANVLILNTCSVTEEADRQARAYVRKARRDNPEIRILVTGCYAQRAPQEVARLSGVDLVVGNSHKAQVAEAAASLLIQQPAPKHDIVPVSQLLSSAPTLVDDHFAHADLALLPPFAAADHTSGNQRTRPNLKVQDGCGNRCSFCVIPQTRGGSRSVPLDSILASVRAFADSGGREIVLSGINLGRWGRDLSQPMNFTDLVETILEHTALPRLRISSVEPMDWTERLLDLYRSYGNGEHPRLARHAHLPLQSGSDAILRAMYRRYRPWHYASKIHAIREAMPDAAIGADVMVGFPGETDALFEESYRFIEQQPFTYLHLFPFSARPGTPAWALHREKPVKGEAVRERMARLRALAEQKHRRFQQRFIGRSLSVVTLQSDSVDLDTGSKKRQGLTRAIADNFLPVELDQCTDANRMLVANIYADFEGTLSGTAQIDALPQA